MKIIDYTNPPLCTFSDLASGEVFKFDGMLCMKLTKSVSVYTNTYDGAKKEINAIHLSDGDPTYLYPGDVVCRVEATLTIQLPPSPC